MIVKKPIAKTRPILDFGPQDLEGVIAHYNSALVISATIANFDVAQVFVDVKSSVNVLFWVVSERMGIEDVDLWLVITLLFGFFGHTI